VVLRPAVFAHFLRRLDCVQFNVKNVYTQKHGLQNFLPCCPAACIGAGFSVVFVTFHCEQQENAEKVSVTNCNYASETA
jgi:hypothetical protein